MVEKLQDLVEVFEIKYYIIKAKSKADAREVLEESVVTSQDKVISLVSMAGGYDAKVEKFVARDWPSPSDKV